MWTELNEQFCGAGTLDATPLDLEGKNSTDRTTCEARVSGQPQSSLNAGELEFILGAFADLIARKFLRDVFE